MIQHKKLREYCSKMLLKFSIEKDAFLELAEKTYLIVDDSEKFFDEDFKFLPITKENVDGYVYMFGGRWYIQNIEDEEGTLTELKYIGEPNQKLPTIHFLGIHSGNELLNGVGMYSDWIKKAKFLGVKTLGICEKSSLSGTISFQTLCKNNGIKPIIGMTVPIKNEIQNYEIKAYAENFDGWQNLLKFSEKINVFSDVYVEEDFVKENCEGLTLTIDPKTTDFESKPNFIDLYQLETVRFEQEEIDIDFINNLEKYLKSELKPIAIQDAYYIEQSDWEVREKLWGIAKSFHHNTKNQYFKNTDQFAGELIGMFKKGNTSFIKLFRESMANLDALVERCVFEYDTTSRHLPKYEMTKEEASEFKTNEDLFMYLVKKGFKERNIKDAEKYVDRLKTEIKVLQDGDVIDYFLILKDIITDEENKGGLVGFGRGSAAGSLVAYLLNITKVDPLPFDLLFERFLNSGRIGELKECTAYSVTLDTSCFVLNENSLLRIKCGEADKPIFIETLKEGDIVTFPKKGIVKKISETVGKKIYGGSLPDIDTDFESNRVSEVKDYMKERFGYSQVVSVGTYTGLKLKSSLKDLGRQLEVDFSLANLATSIIDASDKTMLDLYKRAAKEPKLREYIKQNSDIFYLMPSILDQPKSKSIHACAMIIFPKELKSWEWCPIREQKGMLVSEWMGGEMESAGFLKEDILALDQLDKFSKTIKQIESNNKEVPNLYNLPYSQEVYRYFGNGWNSDVFQMGTEGLSGFTKQLKPQDINDLVAVVALYRPGAMENNFHNIYVQCKNEGRQPEYLWGTEEITKDTFGLVVYQEDVAKICSQLGGLTLKEADDVRRAMGKKKLSVLLPWEQRIKEGYIKNGASEEDFNKAWSVMVEFSKYAFNKCVSGDTKLYSMGRTKSSYHPTVEEMFKLKNDLNYAKSVKKLPLRSKYLKSYPTSFSLNEDGVLVKNKIKDIRFEGHREVFELKLENGATIKTTNNHKFPTSNGEKELQHIDMELDFIYYNLGYSQDKWEAKDEQDKVFAKPNARKGTAGFFKKEPKSTQFLKIKHYKENLKKDFCEKCEKTECRLEVHHIDGNHHTNNEPENLQTLCVSCHKKEHYKIGRTKAGEKGLKTELVKIKSIKSVGFENVYDVEMEAPYHTFTTDTGVVTCNSHSVVYAKTSYASQYYKVNFPLESWTTSLDTNDDGKKIRFLSEIFMTKGIEVAPPDINKSKITMTSDEETNTIYWGIESIKGIGEATAEQIINIRNSGGKYTSFANFVFRNSFTGSKVKKQTFEALISAGAFDKLYGFEGCEQKRMSLINRYRVHKKVKVSNPKRDIYTIGETDYKWWWKLNQKKLTGLVFVDYEEVVKGTSIETQFASNGELVQHQQRGIFRSFGGYVVECKIRSSSRGKFAAMTIESNYNVYRVMIWNDEYERFKHTLQDCEKSFILFDAEIKYEDKWTKGNQFTLKENSEIIILK